MPKANGIVVLDEIDKIAVSDMRGGSVSREGVQRDLLPLIEGNTVATKYGPMKTDHILFIASVRSSRQAEPTCCPNCRAGLPIRVELQGAVRSRFRANPVGHARKPGRTVSRVAGTEGVTSWISPMTAIARDCPHRQARSTTLENIGARRLQTVMEKLLGAFSFHAEERRGERLVVDASYVGSQLDAVAKDVDLSKYVL